MPRRFLPQVKRLNRLAVLSILTVMLIPGCHSATSHDSSSQKQQKEEETTSTSGGKAGGPETQRNAQIPDFSRRPPPSRSYREQDWFREITEESGVQFAYRDGSEAGHYQLLESVGGGIASFDFDRDGWQDLFFTGGGELGEECPIQVSGHSSALYRNVQGGNFEDCTTKTGISTTGLYSHGCTSVDVNGDGFQDLLVAGYESLQLWLNHGDGTFSEVADRFRLITEDAWNVTVAGGDVNRDGLSDLYVLTYAEWEPDHSRVCLNDQQLRDICGPTLFRGDQDRLFLNTGGGFTDVTNEYGLVDQNRGLGVVAGDLDDNQQLDFAVVNDVQANQLYLNDGNGHFEESALLSGIAFSNTGEREGSMGIDLADFNQDALPDLWYTNYAQQDNSLMKQLPTGGFVHSADIAGLTGVSRQWVGFGTGFVDFDCDGWDDLYVINGHVAYERRDSPYFQPAQLFRNLEGQTFKEVTSQGGPYFDIFRSGRGSVRADLDNDGDYDLVITHQNDPVSILKNRHQPKHWIGFELVGTKSDRDAVGAGIRLGLSNRIVCRWRIGGGSYLSHNDPRLLFSLDEEGPVEADVNWLDGTVETFHELETNRYHTLREGTGG